MTRVDAVVIVVGTYVAGFVAMLADHWGTGLLWWILAYMVARDAFDLWRKP